MLCQMCTIVREGMPWPYTGATHYHAHVGLPDKGRTIIGLVVRYVVCLGCIKGIGLRTCARCVDLVPCCGQDGYRAQELLHPLETNIHILFMEAFSCGLYCFMK